MKKVFIMALIAIATTTAAFASGTTANTKVSEVFAASFSNAKNVSWKTESRFEKVSFELGNEKVNAFYNKEGELLGTSKNIAFDKLPKSAIENITTKYTFPEFQVKDCMEFTDDNKEKNYYVSLDTVSETVVLEITKAGIVSVFNRSKK